MAGMGPPPKGARRRTNADTFADVTTVVENDGELAGPPLSGPYTPETLAWWEIWRRSPQAKAFLETDWVRLKDIARLREIWLNKPSALLYAEIRQNESLLGATVTDRLRSRMKVTKQAEVPGSVETAAGVTAINEYKSRLAAG